MAHTVVEECVTFRSEGLLLEGVFSYPEAGDIRGAILLPAPHPHLGGTMDNNVVRHLAVAAAEDGAATLRFNYRGVGRSEIRLKSGLSLYEHWERMEQELRYAEILPDATSALSHLLHMTGSRFVSVVGYSLGSVIAAMLASSSSVDRLVAVAPPVKRVGLAPFGACGKPILFIAGDRDFAFDLPRFKMEFDALPGPKQFSLLSHADHFYRKAEARLYEVVRTFLGLCDPPHGDTTP